MSNLEQRMLNTLTAPHDISKYPKDEIEEQSSTTPQPLFSSLSGEELTNALRDLNLNTVKNYPAIDRYFCDPEINGQNYFLFSFVPTLGSKPDSEGFYGMLKCRGVFKTIDEANKHSEYLIRNVDSYHTVYTSYVGKPTPITESLKYAEDTNTINLKDKIKDSIQSDIKKKVKEEKQILDQIEKRKKEFELLSETETINDMDEYITAMISRANLESLIDDAEDKIKRYKEIQQKSVKYIQEADKKDTKYREKFLDKYIETCTGIGIDQNTNPLIAYLRRYQNEKQ